MKFHKKVIIENEENNIFEDFLVDSLVGVLQGGQRI